MKLKQGKLPNELLRELIEGSELDKGKVIIGPKIGFDSAVIRVNDERCIVVSNDPSIFIPESIPIEYFAFGAVHWAASDVAVFGAKPKWLVYTILFPINTDSEFVRKVIHSISVEARRVGIDIVGGHTAVYKGINTTMSSSTVMGEIKEGELILPSNAKLGDYILFTKTLGLEIAIALAYEKEDELKTFLKPSEVVSLKNMYRELSVVKEALLLAENNLVNAMHDVSEGGLAAALNEFSEASKLGFEIYIENFNLPDYVRTISEHYNIDLFNVSNTGSLLASVPEDNIDDAINILKRNGINVQIIGRFKGKDRVIIEKNGEKKPFPTVNRDAYAKIFE